MKVLKQKIFEVLTNKIGVYQFEEWLYNSNDIFKNLNNNSFYFDIVTINYKSSNWNEKLIKLIRGKFSTLTLAVLSIEIDCKKISASDDFEEVYNIVKHYWHDFDYDNTFEIAWIFYDLEYEFNSFEFNMLMNQKNQSQLLEKTKFYTNQVVAKLNGTNIIEEKIEMLNGDLESFDTESYFKEKNGNSTIIERLRSYINKITSSS